MKLIAPDYYTAFSCLADRCRHTCCKGWEIGIDDFTAAYYRTVGGSFGEKLKNCISEDPEGAGFLLSEDERCPFLNEKGLCDIILELGEDALCQICSDHPRFRNGFSDRTEIGLGLCCEAAADLILSRTDKVRFLKLADDGGNEKLTEEEEALLAFRGKIISLAQDRRRKMSVRIQKLSELCGSVPSELFLPADLLFSLERLSSDWTDRLLCLKEQEASAELPEDRVMQAMHLADRFPCPAEQFLVYLLFRHISGAADTDEAAEYVLFALSSLLLVLRILSAYIPAVENTARLSSEVIPELIREWSAEIEYSDENISRIFDFMF